MIIPVFTTVPEGGIWRRRRWRQGALLRVCVSVRDKVSKNRKTSGHGDTQLCDCLQILFYTFIFILFIFKSSDASVAAGWTWTLNWYWTRIRLILSLCMTHINNWAVREKTAGSVLLLQLFLMSDGYIVKFFAVFTDLWSLKSLFIFCKLVVTSSSSSSSSSSTSSSSSS